MNESMTWDVALTLGYPVENTLGFNWYFGLILHRGFRLRNWETSFRNWEFQGRVRGVVYTTSTPKLLIQYHTMTFSRRAELSVAARGTLTVLLLLLCGNAHAQGTLRIYLFIFCSHCQQKLLREGCDNKWVVDMGSGLTFSENILYSHLTPKTRIRVHLWTM